MATFEFEQTDSFLVPLSSSNDNQIPATSTQQLPSVTVRPLPSVAQALSLNAVGHTPLVTVTQQQTNISGEVNCESPLNRDRSSSPKFIQLETMAAINPQQQQHLQQQQQQAAQGLTIKQESASPPQGQQQMGQLPTQQYPFADFNMGCNMHAIQTQICQPQQHQQQQQPQQQQQQQPQQQQHVIHQPQMLHHLPPQQQQQILQQLQTAPQQQLHQQQQLQQHRQQEQLHQQQSFQHQFSGQIPDYSQPQLVQIVSDAAGIQRTQTLTGQALPVIPASMMPVQQPLGNVTENDAKSTKGGRKRLDTDQSELENSNNDDELHSAMPIKKRPHQVPENLKDEAYWEKRKKNNDSARRSREARRIKEEQVAMRVVYLENENLQLRTEVTLLKNEIEKLRGMLYD